MCGGISLICPFSRSPTAFAVRTRKFIRRHRTGVAAAALVVLALGAGVAGVWWQAQVARTEARKATAIKDFVVGIFERNSTSHPDGATARKTTAEELLAQAGQEIRAGLMDAPEVRAELLGMMARLYSNMEMQKDALPLLEAQLASQRDLLGATHPDVARTLASLALSQVQSGDYPAAIRSATEAQEIFRANHLESALEYAQTYKILGQANYRLGNYQDGTLLKLYQTGHDLVTKYHPRDAERLSMLSGLAKTEQIMGHHDRALARPAGVGEARRSRPGGHRRHPARESLPGARRYAELGLRATTKPSISCARPSRNTRKRAGPLIRMPAMASARSGCSSRGGAAARKRATCWKARSKPNDAREATTIRS
jgi:hypothetical protein